MHERLMQLKSEYGQIKERLREMGAEIAVLLTLEPALVAV